MFRWQRDITRRPEFFGSRSGNPAGQYGKRVEQDRNVGLRLGELGLEHLQLGVRVAHREQRQRALLIPLISQGQDFFLQLDLRPVLVGAELSLPQVDVVIGNFGGQLDLCVLRIGDRCRSLRVAGLDTPPRAARKLQLPVGIETNIVKAEGVVASRLRIGLL